MGPLVSLQVVLRLDRRSPCHWPLLGWQVCVRGAGAQEGWGRSHSSAPTVESCVSRASSAERGAVRRLTVRRATPRDDR